jgi:hypothetical protein
MEKQAVRANKRMLTAEIIDTLLDDELLKQQT